MERPEAGPRPYTTAPKLPTEKSGLFERWFKKRRAERAPAGATQKTETSTSEREAPATEKRRLRFARNIMRMAGFKRPEASADTPRGERSKAKTPESEASKEQERPERIVTRLGRWTLGVVQGLLQGEPRFAAEESRRTHRPKAETTANTQPLREAADDLDEALDDLDVAARGREQTFAAGGAFSGGYDRDNAPSYPEAAQTRAYQEAPPRPDRRVGFAAMPIVTPPGLLFERVSSLETPKIRILRTLAVAGMIGAGILLVRNQRRLKHRLQDVEAAQKQSNRVIEKQQKIIEGSQNEIKTLQEAQWATATTLQREAYYRQVGEATRAQASATREVAQELGGTRSESDALTVPALGRIPEQRSGQAATTERPQAPERVEPLRRVETVEHTETAPGQAGQDSTLATATGHILARDSTRDDVTQAHLSVHSQKSTLSDSSRSGQSFGQKTAQEYAWLYGLLLLLSIGAFVVVYALFF